MAYEDKEGYMRCYYKGKTAYYEHRKVWEEHNGEIPDGLVIDHIDRDRKNNDISNLRVVTVKENNNNQIGKGYYKQPSGKYLTVHRGERVGLFNCETAARLAYLALKSEYL